MPTIRPSAIVAWRRCVDATAFRYLLLALLAGTIVVSIKSTKVYIMQIDAAP